MVHLTILICNDRQNFQITAFSPYIVRAIFNILKCDWKEIFFTYKLSSWDFPGGPLVKNPPSNAGDAGSIPGQGTKIPHARGQLSPRALEPAHHN